MTTKNASGSGIRELSRVTHLAVESAILSPGPLVAASKAETLDSGPAFTSKFLNRPDGRSEDAYRDNERWNKRRWAWEFLTRNEAYRAACDKVADSNDAADQKAAVCERFGLSKFRRYSDSYAKPFPNFALGRVRSWTQIDRAGYNTSDIPTTLKQGQVMILFDLNHAVINVRSLKGQLANARGKLERRLAHMLSITGVTPIAPKPKTEHFLDCLRMLDAVAAGMRRADIARMLFSGEVVGYDNEQARELFKSRFRPAQELVRGGYLEVASAYYDSP